MHAKPAAKNSKNTTSTTLALLLQATSLPASAKNEQKRVSLSCLSGISGSIVVDLEGEESFCDAWRSCTRGKVVEDSGKVETSLHHMRLLSRAFFCGALRLLFQLVFRGTFAQNAESCSSATFLLVLQLNPNTTQSLLCWLRSTFFFRMRKYSGCTRRQVTFPREQSTHVSSITNWICRYCDQQTIKLPYRPTSKRHTQLSHFPAQPQPPNLPSITISRNSCPI